MFYKFFTPPTFKRDEFATLLMYQCNIRAKAVTDGIIFDLEALSNIPLAFLPHWVYLNRAYMLSKLHTRPATYEERMELEFCWRYQLRMFCRDHTTTLEAGNGILDLQTKAKEYKEQLYTGRKDIHMYILDAVTGEVMWEG